MEYSQIAQEAALTLYIMGVALNVASLNSAQPLVALYTCVN
jgi:hypothetical protein